MRSSILILAASFILLGCVTPGTYEDPLAAFHETRPASILVIPVVNNSVDVMASTSVLTTLPKTLGERGYYVFPVNTVKSLLEFEGLADPQEVHDQPAESLAALFSADAILYVTIHSWEAQYLLVQTTTEVDLEYTMTDNQGAVIFSDRELLRYTPKSESSGNLFADLVASAITAAVERAAPNYLPLTRRANANVFLNGYYSLPPGPYHPEFGAYYQSTDEEMVESELQ